MIFFQPLALRSTQPAHCAVGRILHHAWSGSWSWKVLIFFKDFFDFFSLSISKRLYIFKNYIFLNLPLVSLLKQNCNYEFCIKPPSVLAVYLQWFCRFVRMGLHCLAHCMAPCGSLVETPEGRDTCSKPPSLDGSVSLTVGVRLQFCSLRSSSRSQC